jgi:hypothetical protein
MNVKAKPAATTNIKTTGKYWLSSNDIGSFIAWQSAHQSGVATQPTA